MGKYQWLRLPFGLKVVSDVFQEKLDRVIRLLPGVISITDDILRHGSIMPEHDGRVIALLETAGQQSHTQLQKDAVQVSRLQVLWTQTNSRGSESGFTQYLNNHTDEASREHKRLKEFPRDGKLFKQI